MSAPDQYPEDEFDRAARERAAHGSHRERARRASMLPLIAVLAALVVVVWVAALLIGGGDDETATEPGPAPSQGPVESPSEEGGGEAPSDGGGEAPSEGGGESPSEGGEDAPAGDVDLATDVQVLNGARVAGIAGRTAETLGAAGFTNVTADNIGDGPPETSTVFYADPADEATAQEVADALGIEAVEEDAEQAAAASVVVVLRPDFQE
ncbi:LytR C-terminal domain-containing protein [Georgenia sp. Z1344]|uniref:LytR C-terminal domain-containing protein n=1 Tax=Georgenia sp. Z1344 TaxID=3416706 RepID=UPI003CED6F2C